MSSQNPESLTSAMLLAAGPAVRLRPLTVKRAKAVVPFLNRPLLDYSLDWLRRCGFDEVIINLHHCPDTVRLLYGGRAFGLRLRYSVEKKLLGTAGGPRAVLHALGERALLVNADVVTSLSLGPLKEHHAGAAPLATMALHAGAAARAYPAIEVAADSRVLKIGDGDQLVQGGDEAVRGDNDEAVRGADKAVQSRVELGSFGGPGVDARPYACFAGVHLIERRLLELVPEQRACGIVEPIYRQLLAEGLPLHAVVVPGAWYEIGTPERYRSAQLEALHREDFPLAFEGYRRVAAGGYLTMGTSVGGAKLEAPFLLASGVRIADGASLAGVVAGRDVHIGAGATVHDSVLLDGAMIGAGARVERAVVAENAYVSPGTELRDGVLVSSSLPAREDRASGGPPGE